MCEKKLSGFGVQIPLKCIESMHFYSCHSPLLKTPVRICLKIYFVQGERGGGNYDLLIQNLIRKYEDDLEQFLLFCMVFILSKCTGFTVL